MNVIQEFTEWRLVKNFSYAEAGRRLGVDRGTLRQVEQGQRKCPKELAVKMVQVAVIPNIGKQGK